MWAMQAKQFGNYDGLQLTELPKPSVSEGRVLAGFQAGKTVLAPAIGGSVGNAVTQLARTLGAKHAISSTTSPEKAKQAKALGFDEVIDVSREVERRRPAHYRKLWRRSRDRRHRR